MSNFPQKYGFVLIALVLAVQGCKPGVAYEAGHLLDDPVLAENLRNVYENMYPPRFGVRHRAMVFHGRQEHTISGIALIDRTGELKLVGLTELGQTVFSLCRSGTNDLTVHKNLLPWPDTILKNGIARDARVIHGCGNLKYAKLCQHDDNRVGMVNVQGDGIIEEWLFQNKPPYRLVGYIVAKDGKVSYEAGFSQYTLLRGWDKPVAGRIQITDYILDYRVMIDVKQLTPKPVVK